VSDRGFDDFEKRFQELKERFERASAKPLGSGSREFERRQDSASSDLETFWQEAQDWISQESDAAQTRFQQFRHEIQGRMADQARHRDDLRRKFQETEEVERRLPKEQLLEGSGMKQVGGGDDDE
jgi:hypothetical protein